MSASHHPTDIHRRQQLRKKRNKLRALIAAAPVTGRAGFEAKLKRTYPAVIEKPAEKPSPDAV